MGLVEKLEREAKLISPWDGYEYRLREVDLRDLLEQAAQHIRSLEGEVEFLRKEVCQT